MSSPLAKPSKSVLGARLAYLFRMGRASGRELRKPGGETCSGGLGGYFVFVASALAEVAIAIAAECTWCLKYIRQGGSSARWKHHDR